jgi:Holliday junction resolvasome RuvABC endonuclease subunit
VICAGIDLGVRKLAVGIPQMAYAASIDLGRAGRFTREEELLMLQEWLLAEVDDTMGLFVEMPYLSGGPARNATTTIALAETVGMVCSSSRWASVALVGQSTWKAQVCGSGGADKETVASWLYHHERDLFAACDGEDEMDAMCIGLYGLLLSSGAILPPERHPPRRRIPSGRRPAPDPAPPAD